jgi:hypothetical protein
MKIFILPNSYLPLMTVWKTFRLTSFDVPALVAHGCDTQNQFAVFGLQLGALLKQQ